MAASSKRTSLSIHGASLHLYSGINSSKRQKVTQGNYFICRKGKVAIPISGE